MERFVYNPKYAKLLIGMSGVTVKIEEIAKKHDINPGHLRSVIEQLVKEGIVFKDKPGRDYYISLTQKGEVVSKKLAELVDIVKNYDSKRDDLGETGEPVEDKTTTEEPEKVSDNKTIKTTKKVAKKATKLEVKKNDGTTTAATDTL